MRYRTIAPRVLPFGDRAQASRASLLPYAGHVHLDRIAALMRQTSTGKIQKFVLRERARSAAAIE